MRCTARAHANIALIKYWGKRDKELNLPQNSSLSVTLEALSTTTSVEIIDDLEEHELRINGQLAPRALEKALPVLGAVFADAWLCGHARIDSTNNFPTGAGLASSSSGLAALALAASRAAGFELAPKILSEFARRGSGSAARSIFGGYALWQRGKRDDGRDSVAHQLFGPEHWDLRALVCVVSSAEKALPSTAGMLRSAATSPFHEAFVQDSERLVPEAITAIRGKDFTRLAELAETSCLRMHADMLATSPPLCYLTPVSWQLIAEVQRLRADGTGAFFTADAGPNVKVFCLPSELQKVRTALATIAGVEEIIESTLGPGAHVL